jgi:uncharacterized membrane protein YkoI
MTAPRLSPSLSAALAAWAAAFVLGAPQAQAQQFCMSADELREAVDAGHAVPPATASRAAREVASGDVLRIRLCRLDEKFVYQVTTLQRDGRVAHVTIDGASGNVAAIR